MVFEDRNSMGQISEKSMVFLGELCCFGIHIIVPFFDIYLLYEDALMNWLLKVFRMHKFRGSIFLAEEDALLAL